MGEIYDEQRNRKEGVNQHVEEARDGDEFFVVDEEGGDEEHDDDNKKNKKNQVERQLGTFLLHRNDESNHDALNREENKFIDDDDDNKENRNERQLYHHENCASSDEDVDNAQQQESSTAQAAVPSTFSVAYSYYHLTSPRAIAEVAYKAGVQNRKNKDNNNKKIMMKRASSHQMMMDDEASERIYEDEDDGNSPNHGRKKNQFVTNSCDGGHDEMITETTANDTAASTIIITNNDDDGGIETMVPINHNKRPRRESTTNYNNEEEDEAKQRSCTRQNGIEATIKILQGLWKTRSAVRAPAVEKDHAIKTTNSDTSTLSSEALHALEETKNIVFEEFDNFIQAGLNAFNEKDDLALELSHYKELYESTNREFQRLKSSEEASRVSLSNLLKAVETSKASARDAARAAQTEARLRGEVSELRTERDVAIGEHAEARRKVGLLEDEVRLLKSRIARLTQDKIKVERDARAALSLARSMDSHAADDVEYYKRRMNDLNDHLQSKNMEIAELKNQVDEFKRQQLNRSFGQNRAIQGLNSSSTPRRM